MATRLVPAATHPVIPPNEALRGNDVPVALRVLRCTQAGQYAFYMPCINKAEPGPVVWASVRPGNAKQTVHFTLPSRVTEDRLYVMLVTETTVQQNTGLDGTKSATASILKAVGSVSDCLKRTDAFEVKLWHDSNDQTAGQNAQPMDVLQVQWVASSQVQVKVRTDYSYTKEDQRLVDAFNDEAMNFYSSDQVVLQNWCRTQNIDDWHTASRSYAQGNLPSWAPLIRYQFQTEAAIGAQVPSLLRLVECGVDTLGLRGTDPDQWSYARCADVLNEVAVRLPLCTVYRFDLHPVTQEPEDQWLHPLWLPGISPSAIDCEDGAMLTLSVLWLLQSLSQKQLDSAAAQARWLALEAQNHLAAALRAVVKLAQRYRFFLAIGTLEGGSGKKAAAGSTADRELNYHAYVLGLDIWQVMTLLQPTHERQLQTLNTAASQGVTRFLDPLILETTEYTAPYIRDSDYLTAAGSVAVRNAFLIMDPKIDGVHVRVPSKCLRDNQQYKHLVVLYETLNALDANEEPCAWGEWACTRLVSDSDKPELAWSVDALLSMTMADVQAGDNVMQLIPVHKGRCPKPEEQKGDLITTKAALLHAAAHFPPTMDLPKVPAAPSQLLTQINPLPDACEQYVFARSYHADSMMKTLTDRVHVASAETVVLLENVEFACLVLRPTEEHTQSKFCDAQLGVLGPRRRDKGPQHVAWRKMHGDNTNVVAVTIRRTTDDVVPAAPVATVATHTPTVPSEDEQKGGATTTTPTVAMSSTSSSSIASSSSSSSSSAASTVCQFSDDATTTSAAAAASATVATEAKQAPVTSSSTQYPSRGAGASAPASSSSNTSAHKHTCARHPGTVHDSTHPCVLQPKNPTGMHKRFDTTGRRRLVLTVPARNPHTYALGFGCDVMVDEKITMRFAVCRVDPALAAHRAGLRVGDVITDICPASYTESDKQRVRTPVDAIKALHAIKHRAFTITIERADVEEEKKTTKPSAKNTRPASSRGARASARGRGSAPTGVVRGGGAPSQRRQPMRGASTMSGVHYIEVLNSSLTTQEQTALVNRAIAMKLPNEKVADVDEAAQFYQWSTFASTTLDTLDGMSGAMLLIDDKDYMQSRVNNQFIWNLLLKTSRKAQDTVHGYGLRYEPLPTRPTEAVLLIMEGVLIHFYSALKAAGVRLYRPMHDLLFETEFEADSELAYNAQFFRSCAQGDIMAFHDHSGGVRLDQVQKAVQELHAEIADVKRSVHADY
jgi:hypothetical protein